MSNESFNKLHQWRPPTPEKIAAEEARTEKLFKKLCEDLDERKKYLQSISLFPHRGHGGSITLSLSSNILDEVGAIEDEDMNPDQPHEESRLSFSFYRRTIEDDLPDEVEGAIDPTVYELSYHFSVPCSFSSLSTELLVDALSEVDVNYDEKAPYEQKMESAAAYDSTVSPFKIYRNLDITYEIDVYADTLHCRYDTSYEIIEDGENTTQIDGPCFDTELGPRTLNTVHAPEIDELPEESVINELYYPEHEQLDAGESILARQALSDMIKIENETGSGMVCGVSNEELVKILRRIVSQLPK